ncbi:MAG: HupE/UreJ family protein [Chthoniobacteraceae bacterium]
MNFRLLSALVLLPSFAHAHPGHGGGDFSGGFVHPLLGLDHVLAMVATGLWAAQLGGAARWRLPVAFATAMGLSVALGAAGFTLAWTEACIAISVLFLGFVLAAKVRAIPAAAVALVAGGAFFHGLAHASEMPAAGGMPSAAGLLLSSALLQIASLSAGTALISAGRSRSLRWAGAAICASALCLAAA